MTWRSWTRMLLLALALVATLTGPTWLVVVAWGLLALNLAWVVFTDRGARLVTDMQGSGVLPQWISPRALRVFVAVDLAVVALFLLAR